MSTKKLNQITFIARCKDLHGDKFDYTNTIYINSTSMISVVCNTCKKEFSTPACRHSTYATSGCTWCKGKNATERNKKLFNTEWFIEKSCKIHGNKFDYSNTVYITSSDKVEINCYEHGKFEQWPQDHMRGVSCPGCSNHQRWTTDTFIEHMKTVSPNIDLRNITYVNASTPIEFTCAHGTNRALPSHLLSGGTACKHCGKIKSNQTKIAKGIVRDPADIDAAEAYRKLVREISEIEFHKHYYKINPNNLTRGHEYHLDHKFSIQQGFYNNIAPEIIGSWVNLRLIPEKENRAKTNRCLYSIDELLNYYNLSLISESMIIDNIVISMIELPKKPFKPKTEEQRKAQSIRQTGKKLSKHSAEANIAKSLRSKGRPNLLARKPIMCDGIRYPSLRSAASSLSVDISTVYYRLASKNFPGWFRCDPNDKSIK